MQSDLDSLRGIHAIINALYSLFPDMKEREADRLFYKLLEEVEKKQANPLRIAWNGTKPALFRHLVSYAVDVVARDRSVALDVSRPFAKGRVSLETLVSRLREHASVGGVAIICMRGLMISAVSHIAFNFPTATGRGRIAAPPPMRRRRTAAGP